MSECKLKKECKKELEGYRKPIPERCSDCTDNVKFIVENLSRGKERLVEAEKK